MNRTDRLYALVEELRAARERPRSSGWLAERFEVSERTIKRDVSALQQAGVPIWPSVGPGGGYVLDTAKTLPPIAFTTGEALALATALAAAAGVPFESHGRTALQKIVGSMDEHTMRRFEDEAGRVYVRGGDPVRTSRAARTIEEALRSGVVVNIEYADAEGDISHRAIEPMAMGLDRGRWLVFAWCRLRQDGRVFRLDRVQVARLTRESTPDRGLAEVFGAVPADVVSVREARY